MSTEPDKDSTGPTDTPRSDGPRTAGTTPPKPSAGLTSKGRVRGTRASGLWIGLITAAVLAIVFLIFILQNSEAVEIKFLGFEGQISLAVALLLSAVIGMLIVAVPGVVRIGQLRHALRKNAR